MKKLILTGLTLVGMISPVAANAESSLVVNIGAHVDTFCRVYPPNDDRIDVHGRTAAIGAVREICNTPNGYDVATSFSNVSTAQLLVGQSSYAVVDGTARRSSPEPRVQTAFWSLSDIALTTPEAPVVMTVTITPR